FRRLQIHPVVRDLIVTASASLATFIAGLVVISIFGRLLGVVPLSEYLLLRRVAGWLQPLTYLGLSVALPRYIAYSMKRTTGSELDYFVAAITCIFTFNSLLAAALYAARNPLGALLFGSAQRAHFMLPLFVL